MAVSPADDDEALHKPGNNCGDSRAHHTKGRCAQLAENENIVQHQIHKDGHDARFHGEQGLPRLSQGAAVDLHDGKGQRLNNHDQQVFPAVIQRSLQVQVLLPLMEEKGDQLLAEKQKYGYKNDHCTQSDIELGPEGVSHTLLIVFPVILGGEDPRPGKAAENAEIKNKDQLVDDGHTGHGLRAHLAHHHIVQQTDKICDHILYQHRRHHREKLAVKSPVADKASQIHFTPLKKQSAGLFYATGT